METLYFDLRDTHIPQRELEQKIDAAAGILRAGGLLAIPTETVYGLGGNGLDANAVRRIFEAKGRPQDNPLILHVPSQQWLPRYCAEVPPTAYALASKFWPGPLTMILKRRPVVPDETTAGLDTVGVRCPDHPVTLAILRAAGVPVAAPSANTSGRPSCTTAADVLEDMDGKIEGVVDGGPCVVGVESTILDLTCQPPRLLRPGGLPLESIERLIGPVEVDRAVLEPLSPDERPKAPGMKYRHYAPKAPVTVVTGRPARSAEEIARRVGSGCGVICFDEFADRFPGCEVHTLGPSGDKLTQAQRVFDALRTFDDSPVREIYAQCPDEQGLGLAVGNRLKKAAGFHIVEADSHGVVLGLTGGTGAGKTSALRAVRELGGTVIDCDAVYHEMLESCKPLLAALRESFPGAFTAEGSLDRRRLGEDVFKAPDRMARLNQLAAEFIKPEVERLVERDRDGLVVIDAIRLLESGLNTLCDYTVAVTSLSELRVRRIMARDGIDERYARLRVAAQPPDAYYRERCDGELNNAAETPEAFQAQAKQFFQVLVSRIKEQKAHGGSGH